MKNFSMVALMVALASLAPSGCKRSPGKPRLGEVERLPRLETIVLGNPTKLEVVRSYTATVEALEKADVCAMVKGYIKELPPDLDIGRVVTKNELLLKLHVPDLEAERDNKKALVQQSEKAFVLAVQAVQVAEAEVKEAQAMLLRFDADVEYRKTQHARITKLAQGDALSQQQVDEAKLQLNSSQAALTAAKAQVVTKQNRHQAAVDETYVAEARHKVALSDLGRAEVQLEFANLRAPFNGIITKLWVNSGATIKDAGMPIFTLMRTDKVRVIIDVPERDVPYFQSGEQGNKVEFKVPALNDKITSAADKFSGKITKMSSALDPVTRTMRAEMHIDNAVGEVLGILKPQMTGTAFVTLAVRDAFTVPASALVRTGNKMDIFIVADPSGDPPRGTVKRLEVQVGLDDGLRVEVRSPGLKGTELVIVRGAGVLRSGDQVITVPAKAPD
ncbi:MAG TPA: efflux RND transporter periplasmic adaptor subunit [Gemmataceae bacterium]|nr:efflux RND transporter periplasmic adaptor subunit [Gemmataceae bacterium]